MTVQKTIFPFKIAKKTISAPKAKQVHRVLQGKMENLELLEILETAVGLETQLQFPRPQMVIVVFVHKASLDLQVHLGPKAKKVQVEHLAVQEATENRDH